MRDSNPQPSDLESDALPLRQLAKVYALPTFVGPRTLGYSSSNRVVTIFKPEQSTKSGIRLQGSDGPPTIVSLNPEGVAADVLVAGERLLAVNGEVVAGHEAGTQMLKSAVGAAGRTCRHSRGRENSYSAFSRTV